MTVMFGVERAASLTFRRRLILRGAQVKRRRRGRSQNVPDSLDLLHEKGVI
jgi:hypothetical protein